MNIIHVDITYKSPSYWRIIGSCPESVTPSGALYVYRGKNARVIDSITDALIVSGRSLSDVLTKLANQTGIMVELSDEIAQTTTVFHPAAQP